MNIQTQIEQLEIYYLMFEFETELTEDIRKDFLGKITEHIKRLEAAELLLERLI